MEKWKKETEIKKEKDGKRTSSIVCFFIVFLKDKNKMTNCSSLTEDNPENWW